MKNLFHARLTESEIVQALSDPRPPLLPPLGSDQWVQIAPKANVSALVRPLAERAESEIDTPLPPLTDELYADYLLTGQRLPFETLYFERRRRIARAALCALLAEPSDRGRWVESLIANLAGIMDEVSWSLPAHVSDRSGKDPMRIDLFCAETANLMAELVTMFGDVLPRELVASIETRVRTQVFENYLTHHETDRAHYRGVPQVRIRELPYAS
jgi:hypothetical protein